MTYLICICFFSAKEQDWSELVPETERLDTSAHRAKGLLAQKARRQPPSRNKLKESLSVASGHSQVSKEQLTLLRCSQPLNVRGSMKHETPSGHVHSKN